MQQCKRIFSTKLNFITIFELLLPSVTPDLSSGNGLGVIAGLAALMGDTDWIIWLEHHQGHNKVLRKPPGMVLGCLVNLVLS